MDKTQLRDLITRVLTEADLIKYEDKREVELLMMTAAVESNLGQYIRQKGGGPALGIFQMEEFTARDIHRNYLKTRGILMSAVFDTMSDSGMDLEANLVYQIIMARIQYLRDKEALPPASDVEGMAKMYKRVWNTHLGKSTVEEAVEDYLFYC